MSCFTAPCRAGCPIQQDIPAYLSCVDEGKLRRGAARSSSSATPCRYITGNHLPAPLRRQVRCATSTSPRACASASPSWRPRAGGFDEVCCRSSAPPVQPVWPRSRQERGRGGRRPGRPGRRVLPRRAPAPTSPIIERTDSLGRHGRATSSPSSASRSETSTRTWRSAWRLGRAGPDGARGHERPRALRPRASPTSWWPRARGQPGKAGPQGRRGDRRPRVPGGLTRPASPWSWAPTW